MHPSQTLVPRLSALVRTVSRQPRLAPAVAVSALPHVGVAAPRGFFGRLRRPRHLPPPTVAWTDHLSMV
ncbi:hypothetical protein CspeluHIS016_0701280 [Cutaneotrichosporon spelunceum]|uniref:Uncharacterized protein n=1 Tax=Cutaneotrichosporon spelunceum TaxID=1672016 RepID=A0AAD3TY86_9TREE|nr:hypothetical protein CspeluHIS016_0701280 [Cutaneotrichosporon spelunceum]